MQYWASPLTKLDLRRFRARRGVSDHTTLWEALALLISARLWLPRPGAAAHVRSDSLSALRTLTKLSSASPSLNAVARELALDAQRREYQIHIAAHIPGISNVLPDELSRLWAPEAKPFPPELAEVERVVPPPRDEHFWRAWMPAGRGSKRIR